MASLERYKQIEDLIQMPYLEEMGELNKTVLRCSDSCFKIVYSEMNAMHVVTLKQVKAANQAMCQRNQMPTFSGNVNCYLINQLIEFELMAKVKQIMSKEEIKLASLSSVYPYLQRMLA